MLPRDHQGEMKEHRNRGDYENQRIKKAGHIIHKAEWLRHIQQKTGAQCIYK